MFDTFGRTLNFVEGGSGEEWSDAHDPDGGSPSDPPEERDELEQFLTEQGRQEPTIEERTSEREKIYANLLMKTDFERDFIEEMLEIDSLSEEEEMRIDELKRKRREVEEMVQQMPPMGMPPAPQGTTTILI